jgi:pilus assembly protein CpaE
MNTGRAIRALVAIDEGVDRNLVEAALPVEYADLQVVALIDGLDESWKALQETETDLLLVACAGYSDRALFLIDGAVKQRPSRPIVVLSEGSPNGFLKRVFDAGADDIIRIPEESQTIWFALQKALARKRGSSTGLGVAASPLIAVLGPKGGTGKTLTSTNLAVALANEGQRVTLVDLDLQFGDVGLCLGLRPDATIYDLALSGGSIDAEKLEAYLMRHESGLRVLLAPTRPDQASAVSVEFLRELYPTIRSMSDFVITDSPPGFTPEVIATIDSSSDVIVVGMLDSLSLKNTKLALETLELMGYDQTRIRLLLNRANSNVGIDFEDVVKILGRTPSVLVPSDREIPRTVNEGTPIVTARPESTAASAFRMLAALFVERAGASSDGVVLGQVPSAAEPVGALRRLLGRTS